MNNVWMTIVSLIFLPCCRCIFSFLVSFSGEYENFSVSLQTACPDNICDIQIWWLQQIILLLCMNVIWAWLIGWCFMYEICYMLYLCKDHLGIILVDYFGTTCELLSFIKYIIVDLLKFIEITPRSAILGLYQWIATVWYMLIPDWIRYFIKSSIGVYFSCPLKWSMINSWTCL